MPTKNSQQSESTLLEILKNGSPFLQAFINDRRDPLIKLNEQIEKLVKATYNNWYRDQNIEKRKQKNARTQSNKLCSNI